MTGRGVSSAGSTALTQNGGAFVTLRAADTLRGCIGQIEPGESLVETVARVAEAAATEDPRFPPVQADELPNLVFEVSVLGPLEPCSGPQALEVGRHGVVVDSGGRRGLLLPQVAVEWGWDSHTFAAKTCEKAGLKPDAWTRDATLFRFEADVFSETDAG